MIDQTGDKTMRLVIIDDDAFICASLQTILGSQPDIEVVAVGYNGLEAVSMYRSHQPDILLTDIQMPESSGLEATAAILSEWPQARIVLLTTFADDEYIVRALTLGARGYLIKQDVATIAPALRLVMSEQSVLGSEVLERMDHLISRQPAESGSSATSSSVVHDLTDTDDAVASNLVTSGSSVTDGAAASNLVAPSSSAATDSRLSMLTNREFELTELVAKGLDNREIAASLYISEGTVRNMISTILQKLDLKNRTQLAILYYRSNQ